MSQCDVGGDWQPTYWGSRSDADGVSTRSRRADYPDFAPVGMAGTDAGPPEVLRFAGPTRDRASAGRPHPGTAARDVAVRYCPAGTDHHRRPTTHLPPGLCRHPVLAVPARARLSGGRGAWQALPGSPRPNGPGVPPSRAGSFPPSSGCCLKTRPRRRCRGIGRLSTPRTTIRSAAPGHPARPAGCRDS